MWAQSATMPLVVEATLTMVSAPNGRVRAASAWPPQQSTTGTPSTYTHTAAPTSPRSVKLAKNVSRTAAKRRAQCPSIVSIRLGLVVAGGLAEAADLAGEQRGEADRGQVLQIGSDGLQPDRQPLARDAHRERGGGLARHVGQRGIAQALQIRLRLAVHRQGEGGVAGVPPPRPLDVRGGEHVDGRGEQHVPVAEERAPGRAVLLAPAVPEEEVAGRAAETPRPCDRAIVAPPPQPRP